MGWNPAAVCGGTPASERLEWCVARMGLSPEEAQQRIMDEFLLDFENLGGRWKPNEDCDGHTSESRAQWCVENSGLSLAHARLRIMHEFPARFDRPMRWNPHAMCDGLPAHARAKWCEDNCSLSSEIAKERIMSEFPAEFGGKAPTPGAVAALGAASALVTDLVPVAPADPAMLVWSDEFDYTGPPDSSKWGYDIGGHGWGNNEKQYYTDQKENAWVSDGVLRIRAKREVYEGSEFTSARLVTKDKGDWLYGRVEIRLRFPTARGAWAAAWMLPTDWSYGGWPKSGEIDIMEHVGHDVGTVHGTVHTEAFNHMKNTQVGKAVAVKPEEFHTYAVEWAPDGIKFMMEGQQYHYFEKKAGWEAWPFDKRHHILLNMAVGGAWGGACGIDSEAFEGDGQVMEVSSVRVYRLN